MIQVESRRRSSRAALAFVAVLPLLFGCRPGASKFPWSDSVAPAPAEHSSVRTLNPGYSRLRSHVLVREVDRPTRALLDYAAYHQNFMIAQAEPEGESAPGGEPDTSNPFGGLVERQSLTPAVEKLPLSAEERRRPLAFTPLVEYLAAKKAPGFERLQELSAKVRDEGWGLPRRPGVASQEVSELLLHRAEGGATEVFVKIEFEPWFVALGSLPDQDQDGYPELYGRLKPAPTDADMLKVVESDYVSRELAPAELKVWSNQLVSYWYPSFNTDLVEPGAVWPDDRTEAGIRQELSGRTFAPTVIVRGKPHGEPTYAVLVVKQAGAAASGAVAGSDAPAGPKLELAKTKPSPSTKPLQTAIAAELSAQGGSWDAWAAKVAPVRDVARARLKGSKSEAKAMAGSDGFLFFKRSLEYVTSGDLEKQRKGKNPFPRIVEFKDALAKRGVDFLFVPVPTKLEIFPDRLDPKLAPYTGKVLQPFTRKLMQHLSESGVEVVDLFEPLLAARLAAKASEEPLYQRQDTHWSSRGLGIVAKLLARRVQKYPWYAELSKHARRYTTRAATFQRFGDLHSRLPEAEQASYRPESLLAAQVLAPGGAPYDNDPESPVVVLGDSFTGVYELTDVEHAGVSAHLAKEISYPVDLVMSYGGGPNVRNKLMRRGAAALESKKLVIWIMTARDLYDYWEEWDALELR